MVAIHAAKGKKNTTPITTQPEQLRFGQKRVFFTNDILLLMFNGTVNYTNYGQR